MPPRRLALSLALCAALAGCRATSPALGYAPAKAPAAWQGLAPRGRDAPTGRWRVAAKPDAYVVSLSAFDGGDEIFSTSFAVDRSSYDAVDARWGYRESDLAALQRWKSDARLYALGTAQHLGASQKELDGLVEVLKKEYVQARKSYLAEHGFKFREDGVVAADLSYLVRTDGPRLRPLADALKSRAKALGRSDRWILDTATLLVQASLRYEDVPAIVDGVHTGGVWPPLMTLVKGSGDCDTKAALLAAILWNLPGVRMIGVDIGGHYLLGLEGRPSAREDSLRYQGKDYILIEPAGPAALPPGDVGDDTRRALEEGRGYTVDFLF